MENFGKLALLEEAHRKEVNKKNATILVMVAVIMILTAIIAVIGKRAHTSALEAEDYRISLYRAYDDNQQMKERLLTLKGESWFNQYLPEEY